MKTPEYRHRLDEHTRPGTLWRPGATPGSVVCVACPQRCRLEEGRRGACGLRFCHDGVLQVPWGYTSSVAVDPLEKKPFFHVCPGAGVLSFGTLGCTLRCPFCQNWAISQTVRDDRALVLPRPTAIEGLLAGAAASGSAWIAATYNEPLIAVEWVLAVFEAARRRGLRTAVVSNGYASPETLAVLTPCLDAANIDLKCFTEAGYRQLGGHLAPVQDCIRGLHAAGVWVEVTTLVVPGFSDDLADLAAAADFLAGVSPDLPWHLSAYHPDYRLLDGPAPTSPEALRSACDLGRQHGLRFVYAGNLADRHGQGDTRCPGCRAALIRRRGFAVVERHLAAGGHCPHCGTRLAGIWD